MDGTTIFMLMFLVSVALWLLVKMFGPSRSNDQVTVQAAKPATGISIEAYITPDTSDSNKPADSGPLIEKSGRAWMLNPKSTVPLTVVGLSKEDAQQLKGLLDDSCSQPWHDVQPKITAILSRTNATCLEIDAFIGRARTVYAQTIEDLKRKSLEWPDASEKDREDLLAEFRQQAVQALHIRPNADLEILLEGEPKDVSIDDRLVQEFGYENVVFYLRHAVQPDRVRCIPADHYDRPRWDRIAKLGLASRGDEIPKETLLSGLTLKEMAALVYDLSPPTFRRKAKAIEYLMTLPDIESRLREKISYRQMFRINSLPPQFSGLVLDEVKASLAYSTELAQLLQHTYVMGHLALKDRERYSAMPLDIEGWQIFAAGGESACPYCVEQSRKLFLKSEMPIAPMHVGCRCSVSPKIRGFN